MKRQKSGRRALSTHRTKKFRKIFPAASTRTSTSTTTTRGTVISRRGWQPHLRPQCEAEHATSWMTHKGFPKSTSVIEVIEEHCWTLADILTLKTIRLLLLQRTLADGGRIAVQLVSNFTSLYTYRMQLTSILRDCLYSVSNAKLIAFCLEKKHHS